MVQKKNQHEEIVHCSMQCPIHGHLRVRGRNFQGTVLRKFPKRVVIIFERTIYVSKYERYAKARTKLHARLPPCMEKDVHVGDYIAISECRPLSKIIHFVVVRKLRGEEDAA